MTDHRPPTSLPGAWLVTIARAVMDEPALSHAALPTIADFQQEWIEAGSSRRGRWLARWRGYIAFWSLVLIAPIVFRRSPGQGRRLSARTRWIGIGALVLMAVIAGGTNMKDVMIWVLEWIPGEAWTVMGGARNAAVLAGPLAIAVAMLQRGTAACPLRALHMSAAMLFSLLSVTIVAAAGGASVIGFFSGIATRGSPGVLPLIAIVSDISAALRNGLLASVACLLVAGMISLRVARQRRTATSALPAMSRRQAIGLSSLVGVLLLGVDQLLRANHELMHWLRALIESFMPSQSSGQARVMADGLESSLALLLGGGVTLTAVVLVAGVLIWRATRAQAAHHLLTWVSRAAIVVAVAGAAYHTKIVVTELASFHDAVDRLKAFEATRGR